MARERQQCGRPGTHALASERDRALLFRTLATLRTDIALFDDVDELEWHGPAAGFDALGGATGRGDHRDETESGPPVAEITACAWS